MHSAGEVTARPSRGLSTICSAYLIFMADPRTVRLFAQSIKARNPLLLSVTGTTDRSPPSPLVSELAPSYFAARLSRLSADHSRPASNAGASCVTPLAADLRDARRGPRRSAALRQPASPIAGNTQSCARPSKSLSRNTFIVIMKHRSTSRRRRRRYCTICLQCRGVGDIAPR